MQTCGNEGRLSSFSEYYVNISTIHPSVRVVIKLLGKILILVSTFSSFSSFSSIEETVGIERVSANLISTNVHPNSEVPRYCYHSNSPSPFGHRHACPVNGRLPLLLGM